MIWLLGGIVLLILAINIYYGISLLNKPGGPQANTTTSLSQAHPEIPPFQFIDQNGQTISSEKLKGTIYAASFIFTRCPGPCPVISANMAKIHNAFRDHPDVNLLSFTLDPENDTTDILKNYAQGFKAGDSNWHFLTGSKETLHTLSREGFFSAVKEVTKEEAAEVGPIIHGTRICIVDESGKMVAAYNGVTPEGTQQVIDKIYSLLKTN
jgi:protein SCO1/2